MEYLRNLGSVAVSTLVQKSGLNLPFSLGQKVASYDGICRMFEGTKRDDGSSVSVFEYDFSDSGKKTMKPFATNALRKLKTTRHPDVLKFMDAVETDSAVFIMTERVRPLRDALQVWSSRQAQAKEEWLLWGLHRISVALAFVNDSCSSTHGNLCVNSIFVSPSGEWKLGGFELFSNPKDESSILYTMGGLFPGSASCALPEVKKDGWSALKGYEPSVADAYTLGILLYALFNPSHPPLATTQPPHPPPSPSARGSIPSSIFPSFKKLLNPSPRARLSVKGFLDIGMADTGYFGNNRLIKVCIGLDNFALSNESDKNILLRILKDSASSFPQEFTLHRVLPSLLSALDHGGASAAAILPLVLHFGADMPSDDYSTMVLTPLVKLYASPDRGTRLALLEHLDEYVDKLDKKTVSERIFPNLQTGFSDTVAVIRETTVKSILPLSPKFNDRILNNDLLRHLAKMQTDPEASIRTNTCILIGRLAPSLGYHTKRKVLVPAFCRALKDNFVHARVAGLMAFMATVDCFEAEDLATKVIPNVAFTMVDKEKLVRDQAFKAVELFVKKLEIHSSKMPSSAATESNGDVASQQPTLVNTATGAAGVLAGWAISSLGRKLLPSELQSTIDASFGTNLGGTTSQTDAVRPAAEMAITDLVDGPGPQFTSLSSSGTTSNTRSPVPSSLSGQRAKGLTLGGSKAHSKQANIAERVAEEAMATEATPNPWGNDDLIDLSTDQDDWGSFETAPSLIMEPKPISALGANLGRLSSSEAPSRTASSPLSFGSAPSPSPSPLEAKGPPAQDQSSKTSTSAIASTAPSSSSLTKERKAAEMAKKKEERKQRIATLKEQKRAAAKT